MSTKTRSGAKSSVKNTSRKTTAKVVIDPNTTKVESINVESIVDPIAHKNNGHNNAANQVASAVVMESFNAEPENVRDLQKAILSHFSAPEFDVNTFARDLISSGADFTEIAQKVSEAKKAFQVENPAPNCSANDVLRVVSELYKDTFKAVTGADIETLSDIVCYVPTLPLSVVRADSEIKDFVSSSSLPGDASPSALVSAMLSIRHLVNARRAIAQAKASEESSLRSSLRNFARAAKRLGWDVERLQFEAKNAYNYTTTSDYKQRTQLEDNLKKMRSEEKEIEFRLLSILHGLSESETPTQKAKVIKLRARRARIWSSIDTVLALLDK